MSATPAFVRLPSKEVTITPRLRLLFLLARSRFQAGGAFHLLALAVVVVAAVALERRASRELEGERARLLREAAAESAALTPRQARFLPRVERWVQEEAAGAYAGDVTSPGLAEAGALAGWLSRPGVYMRGVPEEMARPDALARTARSSTTDALVLCLLDPPASGQGKALYDKVAGTYMGGALFQDATAKVRPLHEATEALRVLTPAWAAEVRAADAALWVQRLGLELDQRSSAVRAAGRAAASADYLLLVADEVPEGVHVPEVAPAITDHQRASVLPTVEERPHHARLALIDLESDRVLLRVRRRLDASTLGIPTHAIHTQALQGCQLAMEARAAAR